MTSGQGFGFTKAVNDRLGLAKNTIIMFVSDNGGLSTLAGSRGNAPTASSKWGQTRI